MNKKNKTKIKRSRAHTAFLVFAYILITFLALICLYPFWYVVCASFSDALTLNAHQGLLFAPLKPTLAAYKAVLEQELLLSGYMNTLFYLATKLPLSVIVTAMGAYFFTRPNVYFRNFLFKYCLITMYISGGMIAFYLNFRDLGMLNTRWGMIVNGLVSCYNMIILRSSFMSIPESLSDAARIDGAGHLRTFWSVYLPLGKASIAVIALYYGVAIWDAWFWHQIINSKDKWPLQAVLRVLLLQDSSMSDPSQSATFLETARYAVIVVSIIPIILVYPWIQKHFTKVTLAGAVKG